LVVNVAMAAVWIGMSWPLGYPSVAAELCWWRLFFCTAGVMYGQVLG